MLFRGYSLQEIIIGLVVFIFSITIHEIAHGYVAYKLGDPTAKNMGRLTLNPIPHIDLFGALLILLTGYGWAKAVQVNPRNFKNPSKGMAIVSLAGPISNLIIAFIALLIFHKAIYPLALNGIMNENFYNASSSLFGSLAIVNIMLAVINMIPFPPLDGSRIFLAFLPYKWSEFIYSMERYGLIIIYFIFKLLSPIIDKLIDLIYSFFNIIIGILPF